DSRSSAPSPTSRASIGPSSPGHRSTGPRASSVPVVPDTDLVVDVNAPDAVARAAQVLAGGGTVVLPTDTVYGLAALPTVPGATDQLFALKARSEAQPLAVLVADTDQALQLVA